MSTACASPKGETGGVTIGKFGMIKKGFGGISVHSDAVQFGLIILQILTDSPVYLLHCVFRLVESSRAILVSDHSSFIFFNSPHFLLDMRTSIGPLLSALSIFTGHSPGKDSYFVDWCT